MLPRLILSPSLWLHSGLILSGPDDHNVPITGLCPSKALHGDPGEAHRVQTYSCPSPAQHPPVAPCCRALCGASLTAWPRPGPPPPHAPWVLPPNLSQFFPPAWNAGSLSGLDTLPAQARSPRRLACVPGSAPHLPRSVPALPRCGLPRECRLQEQGCGRSFWVSPRAWGPGSRQNALCGQRSEGRVPARPQSSLWGPWGVDGT